MSRDDDNEPEETDEDDEIDPELAIERGTLVLEAAGEEEPGDLNLRVVRPKRADSLQIRFRGVTIGAGETIMDAVIDAFGGERKAEAAEVAYDLMLAAVASENAENAEEVLEAILDDEEGEEGDPGEPPPPEVDRTLRFRRGQGGPRG